MALDSRNFMQLQSISRSWITLGLVLFFITSIGCSMANRVIRPRVVAAGPQRATEVRPIGFVTRTPQPTFTSTKLPPPIRLPSATPTATNTPLPPPPPTATPTNTATSTVSPTPTNTSTATNTPLPPPPPTATFTPVVLPDYLIEEVFKDQTSNHFLVGYIAIVNWQEIPIGGIKAVGDFQPGGAHHETLLSGWQFEGYSAPGYVRKTGSVKFEPPGQIHNGTWFIHLEDAHGKRLSEDVAIETNSDAPEWFFIKFKGRQK